MNCWIRWPKPNKTFNSNWWTCNKLSQKLRRMRPRRQSKSWRRRKVFSSGDRGMKNSSISSKHWLSILIRQKKNLQKLVQEPCTQWQPSSWTLCKMSSTKAQKRLQPMKRRLELLTLVNSAELPLRDMKAITWLMTQPTRRRYKNVWLRKEARGDEGVFPRHIWEWVKEVQPSGGLKQPRPWCWLAPLQHMLRQRTIVCLCNYNGTRVQTSTIYIHCMWVQHTALHWELIFSLIHFHSAVRKNTRSTYIDAAWIKSKPFCRLIKL